MEFTVRDENGMYRKLTEGEIARFVERLRAGERHVDLSREYGRSDGWGWRIADAAGLKFNRKLGRWVERHATEPNEITAAMTLPLSGKEQKYQDRVGELYAALEALDAKLQEQTAKQEDSEQNYVRLSERYETVVADNDRLSREIDALEARIQALTVDQEDAAAAEDAYERAGTLLSRIKQAWSI